jgi:hypothetical protein
MQASRRDQSREISKNELLEIAPFSKGQLTKLYQAGYLPRPQRHSRPGSKKPVYVWDESIIEQAKFLYNLLQWNRSHQWARLPLWLRGYAVEFAPLRQQWLDFIDANLQTIMQGNEEEGYPGDELEDHISRAIDQMKDKWKHTPTQYRPEPFQQFGMQGLETYVLWAEFFLDGLLVADYELGETTWATMFAEDFLQRLQTLQEILSFPRLREVVEQATPEAWEQARLDYMTLCQFLQTFSAMQAGDDPDGVFLGLFALGGSLLVPVALAVRQRGYGHWIDDAFAWVSERLADPETQAMLAWLADPEILARLSNPESRAWLVEQLAQRRTEPPG